MATSIGKALGGTAGKQGGKEKAWLWVTPHQPPVGLRRQTPCLIIIASLGGESSIVPVVPRCPPLSVPLRRGPRLLRGASPLLPLPAPAAACPAHGPPRACTGERVGGSGAAPGWKSASHWLALASPPQARPEASAAAGPWAEGQGGSRPPPAAQRDYEEAPPPPAAGPASARGTRASSSRTCVAATGFA